MTLKLDPALDLGRDIERMKPEDKIRQEATVNALLNAFTKPLPARREVQLLADEVGLGKTFVALATGYSLLKTVRTQPQIAESLGLGKCYRSIVVVVPSTTLAKKWHREVEALRTRCSINARETDWFRSIICENAYDLAEKLRLASDLRRKTHDHPCVLICNATIFSRRMPDLGDRLRFLAACLFRWWGNKLNKHERYRIVSRSSAVNGYSNWAEYARRVGPGDYEVDLWDFKNEENDERNPFTYQDIAEALDNLDRTGPGHERLYEESLMKREGCEEPAGLLAYCKDVAQRRGEDEWYFQGFKARLIGLYKELACHLIRQDLPLVIVDEAHHWRHQHRQDVKSFQTNLAPSTRRLLLLTATPFQMHRDELLNVLAVADEMAPAIGSDRIEYLQKLRQKIQDESAVSEEAGIEFCREWGQLPDQIARIDPKYENCQSILPGTHDPRTGLISELWTELEAGDRSDQTARLVKIPGDLRRFFAAALKLRSANEQLRTAMRSLIIRHRRTVGHRRVLIGREYPDSNVGVTRPDQHLLHLAPGATLPANTKLELAQYLLMKVVADSTQGKHKTTLGMDLTGCYTTLWESKTGSKAYDAAKSSGNQKIFRILKQLTGYREGDFSREDAHHPKVQIVVEEALRRWDQGEKTLIFCFRVPTAKTLQRLLAKGVEQRLSRARRALMELRGTPQNDDAGMQKAIQDFRRSLTTKEGSGVTLFLDRVLLGWFLNAQLQLPTFTDQDRQQVAQLYARATVGGSSIFKAGDRIRLDRVFLNRAIEHVWSQRLLDNQSSWTEGVEKSKREVAQSLLEQLASEDWIHYRYGVQDLSRRKSEEDGDSPTEAIARSSISTRYDLGFNHNAGVVELIAKELEKSVIIERLISGPNLFAPLGPEVEFLDHDANSRIGRMRQSLSTMTYNTGRWEWGERAKVLDSVVRALLREDILLRLPKSVFKDTDETWAAAILRGLHAPPGGGQHEPLAGRVEEFLGELVEMGPTEREAHLHYAMNPRAEAVKVVIGETNERDAVFNGFNTPLLPDILICTQVGQEGIDLHRHCRHVVHYDLGWNPATLEQRTGRTDRLGSKAMRERTLAIKNGILSLPGLDIALPYLAGTYDERMYDRLRSRAQTFEILTGGDPSADREGETSWLDPDDVGDASGADYVQLPNELLEKLRVNLAV